MNGILSNALYFLTFLGYGLFAMLLVVRSPRKLLSVLIALAAALTAIWGIFELAGRYELAPIWSQSLISVLKDGAWFAVMLAMMDRPPSALTTWRVLVAATASLIVIHAVLITSNMALGRVAGVTIDAKLTGLLTIILGFILTENLLRNSSRDKFWAVKYLVIGMAAILAFQFLLQVAAFLIREPHDTLTITLPFFYLLALPLFALTANRSPTGKLQVNPSHRVIFHTTSLLIAGLAFQATAIAAYYLRFYGGDTGTVLAIILAFAVLVSALAVATSSMVRSRLRIFINENFFKYKYDYRSEWTKFIGALSAVEETGIALKVLRTFTDLMDSPGGALWTWKDNFRQFLPVAKWSVRTDLKPLLRDDPILARLQDDTCTLIDLTRVDQSLETASWKEQFPDAWLIVPLRYRSQLTAIILVFRPRAPRTLDWEDRNLIALVAMQLAAYLVHDETSQALFDAKQMEEFNKRFAFVVHDMKNTIGQLALLARNSERFSADPNFQKDMSITLRNAVDKLNTLLVQLRPGHGAQKGPLKREPDKAVDVVELVKSFVSEKKGFGLPVSMKDTISPAYATISDDQTLINVLEHVFANAIEVTPADAEVTLQLSARQGAIKIAVSDHGPGMSQEFINERLFRPFRTTKQSGFGIGAYQARENVRKMGGDFEVFSAEGRGTSIVISLPCHLTERNSVN